jgi:hypothetical protein
MPEDQMTVQDVVDPTSLQKAPTIEFEKVKGAKWVASGLVYIFGGTMLVCLIGGLVLVGIYPPKDGGTPGKSDVIGAAVIPLFQGVGSFAATVFSPLLAFVLGYYFGEKKQGAAKD